MKATNFFHFHVGRGGRFNNAGHKTFVGLVSVDEITKNLYFTERDGNGRFANVYTDEVGHEIITKHDLDECIRKGRVVLEFDTIYDTDVYATVENLLEGELEVIERSTNSFDRERAIELYKQANN